MLIFGLEPRIICFHPGSCMAGIVFFLSQGEKTLRSSSPFVISQPLRIFSILCTGAQETQGSSAASRWQDMGRVCDGQGKPSSVEMRASLVFLWLFAVLELGTQPVARTREGLGLSRVQA